MQAVAPRTLAAIFTGRERGREDLELAPRSINSDDLAREPGSLVIFGRARPRQREHGPSRKLVEGLARRAFRLSLGVLLEGLADAGEGGGGHFFFLLWLGWCLCGVGAPIQISAEREHGVLRAPRA